MPADASASAAATAPAVVYHQRPYSPESFLTLDDSLLGEIKRAARRDPQCSHLRAAAAILRRLDSRDLYLWVAEATVPQQVTFFYLFFIGHLNTDRHSGFGQAAVMLQSTCIWGSG
jgi:hypothetical protein